jgi:hypothetical protein
MKEPLLCMGCGGDLGERVALVFIASDPSSAPHIIHPDLAGKIARPSCAALARDKHPDLLINPPNIVSAEEYANLESTYAGR